jgi:hypothetical protein
MHADMKIASAGCEVNRQTAKPRPGEAEEAERKPGWLSPDYNT